MKKLFVILVITIAIQAHSESVQHPSHSKFQLYPTGNTSAWLLNVETGALSRCVSESVDSTPICAPWAEPPGKSPEYRYDLKTKKMIPMNQAARNKEKEKDPLGLFSSK